MTFKICLQCLTEKDISNFQFRTDTQKYRNTCKECRAKYSAQWYQGSGDVIKLKNKQYKEDNKIKLREDNRLYYNSRYKNDHEYRLHKVTSIMIRNGLKSNGSSKDGYGILQFLPYTFFELKEHLEKQFESWMSWDNWGKYDPKTWDDNDPSTWTWQIDHIIPRYSLQYHSMEDENFKICWSLDNLRPLSSKQNLLDGINKVRCKLI